MFKHKGWAVLFLVSVLLLAMGSSLVAIAQEGTPTPASETDAPDAEVTLETTEPPQATDTPDGEGPPEATEPPQATTPPEGGGTPEPEETPVVKMTPTRRIAPPTSGAPEEGDTGDPGLEAAGEPDGLPNLTGDELLELGISVLIVVLAAFFGGKLVYALLRRLVKRTPVTLDDALLKAARPLIGWWIGAIGFDIAMRRLWFRDTAAREFFGNATFYLYLFVGLVTAWRLIDYTIDWYVGQISPDADTDALDRLLPLIRRALHIFLIIIGVQLLLGRLGLSFSAVITALGIGGLAISLAAQDTLADAIAGITIITDRPFRVGDRIEISGIGTWGDVVEIGGRTTRIRTRDNRLVIVPNSVIAKSQIINYTYPDPRYRVQIEIGIGYGTDIEMVRQLIVDTVSQVKGVLTDKPVDALFVDFGDTTMIFRARWWIESYEDTRHIYNRVNTALQGALDEAGIARPFTTYDVNLKIRPEDTNRISQAFPDGTEGPAPPAENEGDESGFKSE